MLSLHVCFFCLMILRPPRSTLTDTLVPYTTLFRSLVVVLGDHAQLRHADRLAGLARTAAGGTHDAVVAVADAEGSQCALLDEELAHLLCQFAAFHVLLYRSEERRAGKECVNTRRFRWSQFL